LINFRYHLVSLTAVFLALAVGITMGATVVQKATVDVLNSRIKHVESDVRDTESQNAQLRGQLDLLTRSARDTAALAMSHRLQGVDVMILSVDSADHTALDNLKDGLKQAGATVEGTLNFTARLRLDKPEDVAALAKLLNVGSLDPATLRTTLVSRMAASWTSRAQAATSVSLPLTALRQQALISWDAPIRPGVDPVTLALPGTRFVVVSDASAAVPNDQLALPLIDDLAAGLAHRVVAVEAGHDATAKQGAVRAALVGPVRRDTDLAGKVSTVDNLEDPFGKVAVVYALADLSDSPPKVGHYGVGPGAGRYLPSPPP
jgi:Copper transport outer membrane protein, MctB